jgi:hypothetical protein
MLTLKPQVPNIFKSPVDSLNYNIILFNLVAVFLNRYIFGVGLKIAIWCSGSALAT